MRARWPKISWANLSWIGLFITVSLQILISPKAKNISRSEGSYPIAVNQGVDILVAHQPFLKTESLELFSDRGGTFLRMQSDQAKFSRATLDFLLISGEAPRGYRNISYKPRPVSSKGSCKTKLSIAMANAERRVSRLSFSQDVSEGQSRKLDLRAEGGDLVVNLEHGRGCAYWLSVDAPRGNEEGWNVDIDSAFRNEIIVKEGVAVSFMFTPSGEVAEGWGIKLLLRKQVHLPEIEIKDADLEAWTPRLRARSYGPEPTLLIKSFVVEPEKLALEVVGNATIEGERINRDGSRLKYLAAHGAWAATVLSVDILFFIVFGIWMTKRHEKKQGRSEEIAIRAMSEDKPNVFICYSRKDAEWKDRLVMHLEVLFKAEKLVFWVDTQIAAGADWESEIEQALSKADVAILLVTANLLGSDFVHNEEFPKIFDQQKQGDLRVIPVLVKPCAWRLSEWLKKTQIHMLSEERALSEGSAHEVDDKLATIAEEIAFSQKRSASKAKNNFPGSKKSRSSEAV